MSDIRKPINNDVFNAVSDFFYRMLAPEIKEITSPDNIVVAIGGSVSYGFADQLSDVDVYIIGDCQEIHRSKTLRKYLFMHQNINGSPVHFIPLHTNNGPYASFYCLLREEYEKLKECEENLLYDLVHYVPIHDPKGSLRKAKDFINNIDYDFWKERCMEHCTKLIDMLEVFYSSTKRGNNIAICTHFGKAYEGLMQIGYLLSGKPYPYSKWLWNGLESVDKKIYETIRNDIVEKLPCTQEEFIKMIQNLTQVITRRLKERNTIPLYIIEDMMNP